MRRFLWAVVLMSFLPGCILATCASPSRDSKKERGSSNDEEDDDRAERKRKPKSGSSTASGLASSPPIKGPAHRPPSVLTPPTIPTLRPVPTLTPVPSPATNTAPAIPPPAPPVVPDRATDRRWAHQVALGAEFAPTGKSREGFVARWNKPIRLSVMRGDTVVRADLLAVIPTLNEALTPAGAPIKVVQDHDTAAEMKVYFAPSSDLAGIGKANGFTYVEGNDGYFFTFWNARFEMLRAFVLIATDKCEGKRLRHVTFEEVTQALGLSNDSALLSDSIFYENAADPNAEKNPQTELTARDRKLLSFFYTHVSPGDGSQAFGRAFDAHWR